MDRTEVKILLADDVDLFLELEKSFFRRHGVKLFVAKDGNEAYELVAQHRPDLVFIDLHMPGMNGDAVCRLIKGSPDLANVPVVIVTQAGKEDDLALCRASGCDDILLKPINRHHFTATANKYLQLAERQLPRVPARLRIRYGREGQERLDNFSINLSTGGLFIETDLRFPTGAELLLDFELEAGRSLIQCQARVAWTNDPAQPVNVNLPGGMGLQFLDLTEEELAVVRDYIKREFLQPSW